MRAAWYDQAGPARKVLQVGELPDPQPGSGEVRVRLTVSGINPGDTKKRGDWTGAGLPFPRVIPHSDGAGVIDAVGAAVDPSRLGRRVWVYGAQSYRACGTAAEYTVLPGALAVDLPDAVSDEVGACLGIPGITAHQCVLGEGPVTGRHVLIQGIRGAVGSLAGQIARWNGATVIGTVRHNSEVAQVDRQSADHVVALDAADPAAEVRTFAPDGVDRIVEVAFSDNVALDAEVAAPHGVIAAYATREAAPTLPFWPMLFNNLTIRLFGSDDFAPAAKQTAARDLTQAAAIGALSIRIGNTLTLAEIADAHDRVEAGAGERVLLALGPE